MASSVFFRFKSQKEPTRVAFDGTGISVFELKREIITISKLGDGTDFELKLSANDGGEVYDDDTTIIPRSTTVIARRLPASKPGRGGAARYVSGKMPVAAKSSHRTEAMTGKGSSTSGSKSSAAMANITENQTEEERMSAILQLGAEQWEQQQKEMANATPVYRNGPMKGKAMNVPEHDPPPGYVCYRCGEKGHWIQVCPTNDDPTFDGRPRIKRTTGIPRSFLRVVERPASNPNDGTTDDAKHPSGVMVNADGNWVVAEPDNASWEQFRAKTKVSDAARERERHGSKELKDLGLECPIDKRLYIAPTKTPCCETTYCNECITNALVDDDLQCPHCGKEGILIDDLVPDDEMVERIRKFKEDEAAEDPSTTELGTSEVKVEVDSVTAEDSPLDSTDKTTSQEVASAWDGLSKKRKANAELENDRQSPARFESVGSVKGENGLASENSAVISTVDSPRVEVSADTSKYPKAEDSKAEAVTKNWKKEFTTEASHTTTKDSSKIASKDSKESKFPPELAFLNQPLPTGPGFAANIPMAFPNAAGMMGMPMSMGSMMAMNPAMMNPMMMQNAAMMAGMYNPWGMIYPQMPTQNFNTGNAAFTNGFAQSHGVNSGGNGGNFRGRGGQGRGNFAGQQRAHGNGTQGNSDSAYFRQPVNPHRQSRRNIPRPTDYREI